MDSCFSNSWPYLVYFLFDYDSSILLFFEKGISNFVLSATSFLFNLLLYGFMLCYMKSIRSSTNAIQYFYFLFLFWFLYYCFSYILFILNVLIVLSRNKLKILGDKPTPCLNSVSNIRFHTFIPRIFLII